MCVQTSLKKIKQKEAEEREINEKTKENSIDEINMSKTKNDNISNENANEGHN